MTNPLVDELLSADDDTQMNKVLRYFGEQPEVLAAVEEAHRRGVGMRRIAEILQRHAPEGKTITRHSVENYLRDKRT